MTTLAQPMSPRISHPARIWLLVTVLAVLSAVAYLTFILPIGRFPAPISIPWPLLAVCFGVAEVYVIHLEFRADSHSFSLNEVPLVLGLFFLDPGELILAQAVGAGSALLFHRHQPALKLAFNLANAAIGTVVAVLVFRGLFSVFEGFAPNANVLGPLGWTAVVAAVLAADQLVASNVLAAISLSQPGSVNKRQVITMGTAFALANTCLALVAVALLWLHPPSVVLPVVLCAVLILAYNAYAAELRKRKSMDLLVESTRIGQSAEIDSVARNLLSKAREMFAAELAELWILTPDTGSGTHIAMGPGTEYRREWIAGIDHSDGVWSRIATQGRAVRLARPIEDEHWRKHYGDRGIRDLMAAPLRRGDLIIGQIMVANRQSDVVTFSSDDLDLFETLANHASISLQNGRLVDELRQQLAENRHQALHDALTGLPNRTLFRERLQLALAARRPDDSMAVLMMDLDRFKEINDTLGHHTGDLVLKEAARRLHAAAEGQGMVSRLSGDEFGFLLPSLSGGEEAMTRTKAILGALDAPFAVEEMSLELGASVGIAVCPDHGVDEETLLQRADVAMYLAKEAGTGVELYTSERDSYSPARLALSGELRRAIDEGELIVEYQPKFDQRQSIVGCEALVRWQHPERGLIAPDEFIPMAEQTGLIRQLTFFVLNEAIAQTRAWHDRGHLLHIAVNLSIRNLLDVELSHRLAAVLRRHGLPPCFLELEVTESVIMADTARAEAVLAQLHAMGIGLSVDDFGTGLSSYQRLQNLPVNEVKIDRSFVLAMGTDEKAAKIVRSIIDLAHNLGLRVVAEGVEDERAWERLRLLGCDLAQGYFFSRPVSGSALSTMLQPSGTRPDRAEKGGWRRLPPRTSGRLPARPLNAPAPGAASATSPLQPTVRVQP